MVPLVIRIEDLHTGAVSKSAFIKSPVRIGRSELNDLPLTQGFVSQWHAIVQFDDDEVHFVDLGSTNGSVVDGKRADRNVPVAIAGSTEIRIGALKLTFSRRASGEHRAQPRTIFSMKAATAFRPATPAPSQASLAPAASDAPALAAKPGSGAVEGTPRGVPAATAAPDGVPPAEPRAAPVAATIGHVSPGAAGQSAPAIPPAPPAPAAPVLNLPTGSRPAPAAPPPGAPPPHAAPSLDLPTAFRPAAAAPPPAAPPTSAAPPPHAVPALDLPTGFRPAAAAPPPAAPPPHAAPMLDLPTGFRPAAAAPPAGAPATSEPSASRGAPVALDLPTEFRPAVAGPARGASASLPAGDLPPAASQGLPLHDAAGLGSPPGAPSPSAFSSPAQAAAAPRPAPAARTAGHTADLDRLLMTFAESYLPATVQIRGFEDAQVFLGKLAEALEAFARSFVEMRKGYEEFGKQMGIRTVHGDGPVQRARDPRQLIAALLDPGQQARASELQGSFADYMVHQVALLNGVVDGAKAILTRLSPEEIEAAAPQTLWPMKAQALWKAFEERFHVLFEEDGAISDALFGREFGKAYTAIIGRRGAEDRDDDEDDDEDEDEDEEEEKPKRPARKGPRPRRR